MARDIVSSWQHPRSLLSDPDTLGGVSALVVCVGLVFLFPSYGLTPTVPIFCALALAVGNLARTSDGVFWGLLTAICGGLFVLLALNFGPYGDALIDFVIDREATLTGCDTIGESRPSPECRTLVTDRIAAVIVIQGGVGIVAGGLQTALDSIRDRIR